MAIAFRSVGTTLKADISLTGSPQSIGLPAGHVANDFLLMPVITDDNTGPDTPSGWVKLTEITPGVSTSSPYAGYPRMTVFYRIDNGSLGSSVSLTFNTDPWPTGKGYALGAVAAWSGCDTANPFGEWDFSTSTATTAAQAHPQLTLALVNCVLVTLRGVGADTAKTFTISGGTNTERLDDSHGSAAAPSFALYDTPALTTGLQTQRTTTASATVQYGSDMISLALRPAPVATGVVALAGVAEVTATANNPTVTTVVGPWDLCGASGIPDYGLFIDWNQDGDFTDPNEEITGDEIDDVVISYGRDQDRQLSPGAVGTASLRLCNADRIYSPEFSGSPLFGNLDPAREAKFEVTWAGVTFPLFRGRIDDYSVRADFSDRSVAFSFLDGLALLQGHKLSTAVYESLRTGEVINTILDEAGWTAPRDIGLGATVVKFWWGEGTDALTAIQDIVKSEGPPSVAYVAPDGTFVFRDRHHRIQRQASVTSQAVFSAEAFGCDSPAVTGFDIARPFLYEHGWRDIVNSVTFEVSERAQSLAYVDVWTSDDTLTLSTGQGVTVDISTSDPFTEAITPVAGTDYTTTGAGTLNVVLSRTSGQSAQITLLAVGGSVNVSDLKLRAKPVTVQRTVKVQRMDTGSISSHGERSYPDSAPWANANDAGAIADMILLHYSQRRPTVSLRVQTSNPAHFLQVLSRTISDRIHIRNDELGLDDDFFVERVTHTIQRINQPGHAPVHSVVLGCERDLELVTNPFTFDKRGAGFDDGVFDPVSADDASTVFIFDHPVQGQFDVGLLGT